MKLDSTTSCLTGAHQTPASHSGSWSQRQAPSLLLPLLSSPSFSPPPYLNPSLPALSSSSLLLAAASLSFCPFPQPSPPAQRLVQDTEFCAFHRGTLRVRENSCPVRGMEKSLVFTSQRLVFPTFPSQLLRNKGPLARVLGRAQQGDSPATLY